MKRMLVILTGLFVIFAFVHGAEGSKGLADKAVDLVNKGAAYIKAQGKDKAFDEFSNPKGKFVNGELYLFVVDFKGMTLAHGGNTNLIGKNQMELMDADGKYFIKEFIKISSTKGAGWSDYKWSNPVTKKVQNKTTYVKKIDDMDAFIGCGIYK